MNQLDYKGFNISVYSKICTFCKHLNIKKDRSCKAFNEIPLKIWNGDNNHKKPYPGDNGIQFEKIEGG